MTVEAKEELSEAERAMIAALRTFVRQQETEGREETQGQEVEASKKETAQPRTSHVIYVIALALDIALLYLYATTVFQGLEENRVVTFLSKLVPIVGGTLVVSYLEKLRDWILALTTNRRWGISFVVLALVLLLPMAPVYSLKVEVIPKLANVKVEGDPAKFNDPVERGYLLLQSPRQYHIVVSDGDDSGGEYTIDPLQVLRGTVGRLPLIGRWVPAQRLFALYDVTVRTPSAGGTLIVRGPQNAGMKVSHLTPRADPKHPPLYLWTTGISLNSTVIHLPQGTYDFLLESGDCNSDKSEIMDQTITGSGVVVDFNLKCM